jgi:CBS domain-containing protein
VSPRPGDHALLDHSSHDVAREVIREVPPVAAVDQNDVRVVPWRDPPDPVGAPDDNVMEIAAQMAGHRSPLVAVVDGKGEQASMIGAITVARLLAELLPARIIDPG